MTTLNDYQTAALRTATDPEGHDDAPTLEYLALGLTGGCRACVARPDGRKGDRTMSNTTNTNTDPTTEAYWIALGQRAVAVIRWMPGMLVFGGDRITEYTLGISHGVVPDLRDPATLGVVLEQVREVYPDATAQIDSGVWWIAARDGTELGRGPTEAEALLVALETAKRGEA